MTSGFFDGLAMRGLAVRVLLFLSITMLPIGLLSVFQTRQLSDQTQERAELSLLVITQSMTAANVRLLQEAYGAADALGAAITGLRQDPERCSSFFQRYRRVSQKYKFVGLIDSDGIMSCSSFDQTLDFSSDPAVMARLSTEGRYAFPLRIATAGDKPQALVASSARMDGVIIGSVAVSIPVESFDYGTDLQLAERPDALVIFNEYGQVLAGTASPPDLSDVLPTEGLQARVDEAPTGVFRGEGADGTPRVYAVVPLVPGAVYALSIWPGDMPFSIQQATNRLNLFLPILMWVASLVVAFWAIHRLAISRITKLGRQMRLFALNRTLPRERFDPSVPTELAQMERSFSDMAESILKDEATLEDNLRQKNILLKEVHHRVKNNLQLISSILNMQIRQARQADTRQVLERFQHRILGLSTVHETLYQDGTPMLTDVPALLTRTVDHLAGVNAARKVGVEITQTYDQLIIEPDDAAPLTLLVSEAVTNALEYFEPPADGPPEVRISLTRDDPRKACLLVENTTGPAVAQETDGLGLKLITAFTRQLNGALVTEKGDGWYRVSVVFPLPEKQKPVRDY